MMAMLHLPSAQIVVACKAHSALPIKKAMRSSYKIEQKTRTNILYLQSDASRMNLRSTSKLIVVVHKSCACSAKHHMCVWEP